MRTTRHITLLALLMTSLTACSKPASDASSTVAPPSSKWQAEEFPIGFWVGPPPALNTLEAYRMMKDCGFTMASTSISYTKGDNLKMLDHCQTVGIKALVGFHAEMIPTMASPRQCILR